MRELLTPSARSLARAALPAGVAALTAHLMGRLWAAYARSPQAAAAMRR